MQNKETEEILFNSIKKNAKVAIFSTTKLALSFKKFLSTYRQDLSIVCFIDSFREEKLDDLNVYKPNNIPQDVDIVIIASKANKKTLANILEENNWTKYITIHDGILELLENQKYKDYFKFVPPGHYYSPIPTIEDTQKALQNRDFNVDNDTTIDYNIEKQLETLEYFSSIKDKYIFTEEKKPKNYYFYGSSNKMYGKYCSFTLMGIVLKNKPKRIIEVGSGYSTAFLYDINRLYFDNKIQISAIEPYPHRLKFLFGQDYEKLDLQETNLQNISLSYFDSLEENDILFIDSSHVSKANSDVNYILFNILPRLKKGVIVHFHDIGFPYEYPERWFNEGRHWNEIYMIRAFLSYNTTFKIEFFGNYLRNYIPQKNIKTEFANTNLGGSIYIRKVN